MILGILGRYDEALQTMDMAIMRDSRHVRALEIRSKLLGWIAARQLPDQIPVDLVETADTCLSRAVAMVEKGAAIDEALPWVERALKLSPKHRDARETLAGYLLRLGRFDEAMIEYDRLFRGKVLSGRKLAHAEWAYAVCLREVGRFDEALSFLDRAGKAMPGNLDLAKDRAATVEALQKSRG
jgi:tetratricopeptide (TPR) repeat protein